MSDEVQVSFTALRAGSDAFVTHRQTMVRTLEHLEQDLNPMVSSWDGEAKAAYTKFKTDWRIEADDLTQFLHEIQQRVEQSAQRYQGTEGRNVERWGG